MTSLHNEYLAQLASKQSRLSQLLSPHFSSELQVFPSAPEYYRMRAEFRIWHDGPQSYHIMFDQVSKEKYKVSQLPAACRLINKAMEIVIDFINQHDALRKKLFQIDYLASTTNQLIISMIYHKPLDDAWEQEAELLRHELQDLGVVNVIGRSKKQKVVLGNDFVIEKLELGGRSFEFKQIENSFTQPNAQINVSMLEWTMQKLSNINGDLLELYCGSGNFSVPLAHNFKKVFATEISKTSVNAAQYNIHANDIRNLTIARLSSEEFTEAYNGVRKFFRLKDVDLEGYDFSTVLVDPPRAGLDIDTIKLISRFENIVYISCNPETLADNLAIISTSHDVVEAALFDQFPFTEHIETGVILKQRQA